MKVSMHEKYIGSRQKVGEFQCGAVPPLSLLSCPPHLDGKDDFTGFLHHKKRYFFAKDMALRAIVYSSKSIYVGQASKFGFLSG